MPLSQNGYEGISPTIFEQSQTNPSRTRIMDTYTLNPAGILVKYVDVNESTWFQLLPLGST